MNAFHIGVDEEDGMVHLRAEGSLRADSIEALNGELQPLRFSRPSLLIADLRGLEMVDNPGVTALRLALGAFPQVAWLLPPPWTQAYLILRELLEGAPFHQDLEPAPAPLRAVMPVEERRSRLRIAVKMQATLIDASGRTHEEWTIDLSRGGARVTARKPARLADLPVTLAIAACQVPVRVARIEVEPAQIWGLEFLHAGGALDVLFANLSL